MQLDVLLQPAIPQAFTENSVLDLVRQFMRTGEERAFRQLYALHTPAVYGLIRRLAGPMSDLADSPETAFELYASRYYALRTMFETDRTGPSPIADPDLKMVEPDKYSDLSAPTLQGLALPRDALRMLYNGAAENVVFHWIREHP